MDYVREFMGFHFPSSTRRNLLLWVNVLYKMFTHVQRSFPVANCSSAEIICSHFILLPECFISGYVLATHQLIVEESSQVFCPVLWQRTAPRLYPSTTPGTIAVSKTEIGIITWSNQINWRKKMLSVNPWSTFDAKKRNKPRKKCKVLLMLYTQDYYILYKNKGAFSHYLLQFVFW